MTSSTVELAVAAFALRKGFIEVVQAAMLGAILNNLLLVIKFSRLSSRYYGPLVCRLTYTLLFSSPSCLYLMCVDARNRYFRRRYLQPPTRAEEGMYHPSHSPQAHVYTCTGDFVSFMRA